MLRGWSVASEMAQGHLCSRLSQRCWCEGQRQAPVTLVQVIHPSWFVVVLVGVDCR